MNYYVHSLSDVHTISIGQNSQVWQYSVILPNAQIGESCNICSHCFIENDVIIGDRVTIKSGVQLWDGLRVKNDVFIGPNVTFTNDRFPRSKKYPDKFLVTTIEEGASIGGGAVILPGLTIGSRSMIAAGTVVTRSIPANAIVVGNPGKIIGYVDTADHKISDGKPSHELHLGFAEAKVKGVNLHRLPKIPDIRGNLTVGEFERGIPFPVKRFFMVYDVPSKEIRGEHAHRECHQFLICIRGSCSVVVDDGDKREEFVLDRPDIGIHIRPMVWGIQYKYSADALLLVFASHYYDDRDYIRNYEEFLQHTSIG